MSKAAMVAREEDLADLKLYRVPEPVTVAAQSQKQIAFLDEDAVKGRMLYSATCAPWRLAEDPVAAGILLATVNDRAHGLGRALPTGGLTVFESAARGEMLAGEQRLRDYAAGQDVELELGESAQVFARCTVAGRDGEHKPGERVTMLATLTNANPSSATLRLTLGGGAARIGGLKGVKLKDGAHLYETTIPANGRRTVRWTIVDE
jgi:hypothetical protein